MGDGNALGFVPGDNVADANLPQASSEGKECEDDGGEDGLPILKRLDQSLLLRKV